MRSCPICGRRGTYWKRAPWDEEVCEDCEDLMRRAPALFTNDCSSDLVGVKYCPTCIGLGGRECITCGGAKYIVYLKSPLQSLAEQAE